MKFSFSYFTELLSSDCPKLMADESLTPKRSVHGIVKPQSNTTHVNENTLIYSKRMEIELKERKGLSCCLTVIFPGPRENVSPSRIKNMGG